MGLTGYIHEVGMSVPKYYEFHKLMLKLMEDGKAHYFRALKSQLIAKFLLSDDDLAQMLPSGRRGCFSSRVGRAGICRL